MTALKNSSGTNRLLQRPLTRDPLRDSSSIVLPGQSALSDSGRQYWHSVARIGIQVAQAPDYAAGQGVLHRDITPSNLLLDTQSNVWVTDFGLAKATVEPDNLTTTGEIVGTMRYIPPERFSGHSDIRGDIYSLGLTLYELLTFRVAYPEENRFQLIQQIMHEDPLPPRRIDPGIPRDLETIILKATARDPAHRYQRAADLAVDLQRFVDDRPIHTRRVTVRERLWRLNGIRGVAQQLDHPQIARCVTGLT